MRITFRTAVAVALLLAAPVLAFSANGDTINIGGQVPLVLTLTVTPSATADNLTLYGSAGSTTSAIASIDIATNNSAGWELWVFSTNAGATTTSLQNADGNSIGYTITYAGANGASGADITNAGLKLGEDTTSAGETGSALSITYTQATTHPAGYFSDQLAIVLRAK